MTTKETTVKLTVADNFSAQLRAFASAIDSSEKQVSKTSQAMQKLGDFAKTAAIAGFGALTAAVASSIKSSMELESTFGKIAGLTDTAKGSIDGLRDSVVRMSTDIPVSANELAQGMYFISSSGYQGAEALKILEASGKAAAAGLGETQVIADAVTSALNAYGLGAQDATRITDILVQTVKEGKGEPAELAGSLGKILPIAAQAGVSMEQVAASMATMTRTGMNADEAATSLRGTIAALMAPGKQAVDALAAIGLTTDDVANKMKSPEGLIGVLQLLMERTGGNVAQLDAIIPNIRALTGVLSSAGSQGAEYARILGSMQNAAGATDGAFAAMSETLEFKVKKAQNSLEALGTAITNKLLPGLGQAADAATVMINWQDKLNEAFDATSKNIIKNAGSYEEYRNNIIRIGVESGKLTKIQADLIMSGKGIAGAGFEDITQRVLDNLGIVSREAYAVRNVMDETKRMGGLLSESADRGMHESASAAASFASEEARLEERVRSATGAIEDQTGAQKEHTEVTKEEQKVIGDYYGGLTQKAIDYTETAKNEAELRQKLADLDKQIAARGPVRVSAIASETSATSALTEQQVALSAARNAADDVAKRDNETSAQYAMRLKDAQTNLQKLTEQTNTQIVTSTAASAADQKSALAQAKLAAAQEDLTTIQRKKNETDAEFALRVETLKSKIAGLTTTLDKQTTATGGATAEQLKNRDAILEQIKALQLQDNTQRAMEGFAVLKEQLKDGIIDTDQYIERTNILNNMTHMYTPEAMAAAQAQEQFLRVLGDPNASFERIQNATQAYSNSLRTDYIPTAEESAKKSQDILVANTELGNKMRDMEKVKGVDVKIGADTKDADKAVDDFKRGTEAKPVVIKVSTVTTDQGAAERDKQVEQREKNAKAAVDSSAQSVTTSLRKANDDVSTFASKSKDSVKGVGDTTQTTFAKMADTVASKFGLTTKAVSDAFYAMQLSANNQLSSIYNDIQTYLPTYRELIYKIIVQGEPPEGVNTPSIPGTGAQHGANFVVPENPRGGLHDYYPVIAAPGERVIVQTVAQQQQTQSKAPERGGDTYNYNTVINDKLAATMWLDKQRRERIARSEARMGV